MYSKLLKSTELFRVIVVLVVAQNQVCTGSGFQYFEKSVDYWNENKTEKTVPDEAKPKGPAQTESVPQAEANNEKFPWKQYLDPKNKEFFKEGDYTPPEPFMELARDPSDENMKMWFAYIEKKNELQTKLQERMAAYVAKKGLAVPPEQEQVLEKFKAPTAANRVDSTRYRLRMYFSSTCPHCKKMMATLSDLQTKGFFVETRQIDPNNPPVQLPFPTEMASASELKGKDIESVPLLLIADLKKKAVYRVTGFKTTSEVLDAIRQQESGT